MTTESRIVLTVDVEDWYHDASGLGAEIPFGVERRVGENLRLLLDLLDEVGARATFFVLGEVAAAEPALVRRAFERGHEIASHGFEHRRIAGRLRSEVRLDLASSRQVLEQAIGARVAGFRAPYFSVKAGWRGPLQAIAEAGYRYDSSILPIDRLPGLERVTPLAPYRLEQGIWEVPIAVNRFGFWNLPLLGGFALRVLPIGFLERRLADFQATVGPPVVHLHPWELDAGGPELDSLPGWIRTMKRAGRRGLSGRLRRFLGGKPVVTVAQAFPEVVEPFHRRESVGSGG